MESTMKIEKYYGSRKRMLAKYEQRSRQDAFQGETAEEFDDWKIRAQEKLKELIGWDRMETCPLEAKCVEKVEVEPGILREKVILQVEPETYMPVFILIPEGNPKGCFLALPGHQGAGKYSVAGVYDIPAVRRMIEHYNYDYGMQLARAGYVAVCPDCRGFGERRDEDLQNDSEEAFLNSTCFQLAHMAEPLGETVIGMCTWDVTRLIDYLYERGEWDLSNLGCLGFSGGGMQTLWASALDSRIRKAVISGYLYGYRDSLLILNGNCSCNYVPGLWEHFDMGDIASLIAPRPCLIQSCSEDHLNGPRGLINVEEQLAVMRRAYVLYGREEALLHDVQKGDHCFYWEPVKEKLSELESKCLIRV